MKIKKIGTCLVGLAVGATFSTAAGVGSLSGIRTVTVVDPFDSSVVSDTTAHVEDTVTSAESTLTGNANTSTGESLVSFEDGVRVIEVADPDGEIKTDTFENPAEGISENGETLNEELDKRSMDGGDETYYNADGIGRSVTSATIPKSIDRDVHTSLVTWTEFEREYNGCLMTQPSPHHNATYPIVDPISVNLGGFSGSFHAGSGESLWFIVEKADSRTLTQNICVGKSQVNEGSRVGRACVKYNLRTGTLSGGSWAKITKGSWGNLKEKDYYARLTTSNNTVSLTHDYSGLTTTLKFDRGGVGLQVSQPRVATSIGGFSVLNGYQSLKDFTTPITINPQSGQTYYKPAGTPATVTEIKVRKLLAEKTTTNRYYSAVPAGSAYGGKTISVSAGTIIIAPGAYGEGANHIELTDAELYNTEDAYGMTNNPFAIGGANTLRVTAEELKEKRRKTKGKYSKVLYKGTVTASSDHYYPAAKITYNNPYSLGGSSDHPLYTDAEYIRAVNYCSQDEYSEGGLSIDAMKFSKTVKARGGCGGESFNVETGEMQSAALAILGNALANAQNTSGHPWYPSDKLIAPACKLTSAKVKAGLATDQQLSDCKAKQSYIADCVPHKVKTISGLDMYTWQVSDKYHTIPCQAPWSKDTKPTYNFKENYSSNTLLSLKYSTLFIEESPETIFIEDAGSIKPPADWVGNLEDVPAF